MVWISALFILLSVIGLFRTDDWGAPATLINPLLLEFVVGMWIGVAVLNGRCLPRRAAAWLAPLMVVAMWASCSLPPQLCYDYRVLLWGVPGAILLASVVALEPSLPPFVNGWPRWLGDASYAIYLSQGVTLAVGNRILDHIPSGNDMGMLSILTGMLLATAAAGIVIHRVIEKPLMTWLTHVAARRRVLCAA